MCTIHTVMSTDSTILLLFTKTKQKNQCNEASHPLKRAQRYLDIIYGEVSLQIKSATIGIQIPCCQTYFMKSYKMLDASLSNTIWKTSDLTNGNGRRLKSKIGTYCSHKPSKLWQKFWEYSWEYILFMK